MQHIPCDVATLCVGQAYSMSAILLAGVQKASGTPYPTLDLCCINPGGALGVRLLI